MKATAPLHPPLGFFTRLAGAVLLLLAPFTIAFGAQTNLGGPYAIGGKEYPDANQAQAKVAEFEAFRAENWSSSEVSALTPGLFTKSVAWNAQSNVPYADKYQRYNYVVPINGIPEDDTATPLIFVATWSSKSTFNAICTKTKTLPEPYKGLAIMKGIMVNFFPEEPDLPSDKSQPALSKWPPCVTEYSDSQGSIKYPGVLDANGKHFMLAQGLGKKLTAYKRASRKPGRPDLAKVRGHDWVQTKVLYAGEIIVDVEGCSYFINQGSGTYKPKPGDNLEFLRAAAKVFKQVLVSPPALVWTREVVDQHSTVRAWPVQPKDYDRSLVCSWEVPTKKRE